MGELRRYILDSLRRSDFSRCEDLLTIMDEIYGILITMDFPELLAHGLRRTTDTIRNIIEITRGDLTVSLRQKDLETKLADFIKSSLKASNHLTFEQSQSHLFGYHFPVEISVAEGKLSSLDMPGVVM